MDHHHHQIMMASNPKKASKMKMILLLLPTHQPSPRKKQIINDIYKKANIKHCNGLFFLSKQVISNSIQSIIFHITTLSIFLFPFFSLDKILKILENRKKFSSLILARVCTWEWIMIRYQTHANWIELIVKSDFASRNLHHHYHQQFHKYKV